MSDLGDRTENWRGSYDGWLSTDRSVRRVAADVRDQKPDYRLVDAAERAYFANRDSVDSSKLAYVVARRSLRVARDVRDLAVRADWIKAAGMWRGLARDLRRMKR